MDPNKFTQKTQEALQAAQNIAVSRGHQAVDAEHLLYALCEQEGGLVPRLLEKLQRPADVVVGQGLFTSAVANYGGRSGKALRSPLGDWADGRRLYEADIGDRLVLIWSSIPSTSFELPAVALGQPDFSSADYSGLTANSLVHQHGKTT